MWGKHGLLHKRTACWCLKILKKFNRIFTTPVWLCSCGPDGTSLRNLSVLSTFAGGGWFWTGQELEDSLPTRHQAPCRVDKICQEPRNLSGCLSSDPEPCPKTGFSRVGTKRCHEVKTSLELCLQVKSPSHPSFIFYGAQPCRRVNYSHCLLVRRGLLVVLGDAEARVPLAIPETRCNTPYCRALSVRKQKDLRSRWILTAGGPL